MMKYAEAILTAVICEEINILLSMWYNEHLKIYYFNW